MSNKGVREWTRTQREDEKTERQRKALELYLQCYTQQEIAEKLGWSQQIISNDLAELTKNGENTENGNPDPLRAWPGVLTVFGVVSLALVAVG